MTCARCNQAIQPTANTPGYGGYDGKRYCFPCCGKIDAENMAKDGRATLYLTIPPNPNNSNKPDTTRAKVSNWPGTLHLPVHECYRIRHNMARSAYVCRFIGPDGFIWTGRNIGDNQILRAKRTNKKYNTHTGEVR